LSAAVKYMQDGGGKRHVAPLIKYFGETPLSDIGQDGIDDAAVALYPNVTAATRARQVYTPASAILHHALGEKCPQIRRPKGAKGKRKTDFLWPDDTSLRRTRSIPSSGCTSACYSTPASARARD